MQEVLFIILGWLFGLLGAPIVSRIERRYKRNDLKAAIFSELRYLIIRLAATSYKIQMHLGMRDKSALRWVKGIYERYWKNCPKSLLEAIEKLLIVSEEQFHAAAGLFEAPENIGLGLKTFSLPFTESILEYLSVFDLKFQKDIFEVRDQVGMLNEEIENSIFYFRLTFDPTCMNINKGAIRTNIRENYNNIQGSCKSIVDKIEKILGSGDTL